MTVQRIRGWHTNQPYTEYAVYLVNGVEVTVKFGGMRQTWDCQSFRAETSISPDTPEIRSELKAKYPKSVYFAELTH